jgi:uncharacterized protein (TIGR02246 family)
MGARRLPVFVVLVLLLAPGAPARAAQSTGTGQDDEQAVRALVARYVDARERRDPASIGALLTSDADQFTSGGEWRRGREAVVAGTLRSSERTGGTRGITVRRVRFLTGDLAIADGLYEISGTRDGSTRRLWTTIVMTRDTGGWRIAAIRNASPTAIPE